MASRITNQGLEDSLDVTFGIIAADPVDAMGVSDFGSLAAATVSIAAATNKQINALDTTPTRAGQTVTCKATFTTAQANFNITTITLHNDGAGVATGVFGGIDGQSITKNSGFSLTITVKVTYATA